MCLTHIRYSEVMTVIMNTLNICVITTVKVTVFGVCCVGHKHGMLELFHIGSQDDPLKCQAWVVTRNHP